MIRQSDSITYITEPVACDGSSIDVVTNRQCEIPIATLRVSPFNLPWGSSVYAKLSAINLYGTSQESAAGNGAQILTNPDAPVSLANDPAVTLGTQIGLTWLDGTSNGGTIILDYKIWSDQATDSYIDVADGITDQFYTVTALSVGSTYKFKIQSRNSFGFSAFSSEITVKAAQKPDKPDAPTTTFDTTQVKIEWTAPFD